MDLPIRSATTCTTSSIIATHSATHSALQTVELLEMILLHLPINVISRLQRTSKFWQAAINNSSPLRVARFLEPVKKFETLQYVPSPITYEPSIMPTTRPLSEMRAEPQKYPIVSFHPLLLLVLTEEQSHPKIASQLRINIAALHDLFLGPWLNMLISQPPLQETRIRGEPSLNLYVPPDDPRGGLTFRNLLQMTILCKTEQFARLHEIAYENLWLQKNELLEIQEFAERDCGSADQSSGDEDVPKYRFGYGWTGGQVERVLNFEGVVAEHGTWVQQARERARKEMAGEPEGA